MTRRKDGTWQQAVSIAGKRKYFYGKTKAEVLQKISTYKGRLVEGPTFAELSDMWYAHHTPSVRYKTVEGYTAPLKQINEHFGDFRAEKITPPMITAFIREIENLGYARRTVQLRLDILAMIFDYAISEVGCISINPCDTVTLSKTLKTEKRELPKDDDIQAIVAHKNDDRFSLLPYLLYCTGLRLGEALALTDKDFSDGYITICKQVSWQPNQPVIEHWTKTERGFRSVPILDILKESLPKWKGYLFSDDGNSPYSNSAFRKRWKKYEERTGVTCIRHVLRHEFATLLFEASVDVKDAADMMGHDEKVMREIYTHIKEKRRKNTSDKLNEYVNMMYDTPKSLDNT